MSENTVSDTPNAVINQGGDSSQKPAPAEIVKKKVDKDNEEKGKSTSYWVFKLN
jgi:hypothetical protein